MAFHWFGPVYIVNSVVLIINNDIIVHVLNKGMNQISICLNVETVYILCLKVYIF